MFKTRGGRCVRHLLGKCEKNPIQQIQQTLNDTYFMREECIKIKRCSDTVHNLLH